MSAPLERRVLLRRTNISNVYLETYYFVDAVSCHPKTEHGVYTSFSSQYTMLVIQY
jgi:hypothetical protein